MLSIFSFFILTLWVEYCVEFNKA